MKKILVIYTVFLIPAFAQAKKPNVSLPITRVAIQTIQDKSASANGDACGSYGIWSSPGDAAREILVSELTHIPNFTIVEREKIDEIYEAEFAHENLDKQTKVKKGKFIAANYAIAGAITEFEWCLSGQNQGIDVGGLLGIGSLSVSHTSSKAHVAVNLRLIDVRTGKILSTSKGEGKVDDSGYAVSADAFGLQLNKEEFRKSPLGQATQTAVASAAKDIIDAIQHSNL